MNAPNNPRQSEIFLVGQSVITLRADRHPAPPTEYELIRDELRKISETKSRRRGKTRRSAGAR